MSFTASPASALDKGTFSLSWLLEHSCGLWRVPARVDLFDHRWYHGALLSMEEAVKIVQPLPPPPPVSALVCIFVHVCVAFACLHECACIRVHACVS